MRRLTCLRCQEPLCASTFDEATGILVCRSCQTTFDLVKRILGSDEPPGKADGTSADDERAVAPVPRGWSQEITGDQWTVSQRWRETGPVAFTSIFAIIWNVLTIIFTLAAGLILPLSPFWLIGAGAAYFTLKCLFNTTKVSVDSGKLHVAITPFSLKDALEIDVNKVDQIYLKRSAVTLKSTSVSVRALTTDHREIGLVDDVSFEEGLWLEQELERHLGIRDRAVVGEFRPNEVKR